MRYLTKSRFKLALECPTKLFYTCKPEFPDTKVDDPFLEALAEGGFQVGALAKLYYPDGIEVTDTGYDTPLIKTDELLKNKKQSSKNPWPKKFREKIAPKAKEELKILQF